MKKSQKKAPSKVETEGRKDHKSLYLLIGAIALVLVMNLIFFATYPINVAQSDNITYLQMMVKGSSNLFHASGYPTVLRLLIMSWYPVDSIDLEPRSDGSTGGFNALQG